MTEQNFKYEVTIAAYTFVKEDRRFLTNSESVYFNGFQSLTIEFMVKPDVIVTFVFNWDHDFGYRVCGYATTEERLESNVTYNLDGSVTVRPYDNRTFGFYGFTKEDLKFVCKIGELYDKYCRERYILE